MSIVKRAYDHATDYAAVGEFLVRTHGAGTRHRNWLQPRWEYMHYHPLLDAENMGRFGVWEDRGEIVGVVHYEHKLGVSYLQLAPGYAHLGRELIEHAAANLVGELKAGRGLYVYIEDADEALRAIARSLGFEPRPEFAEPMARLAVPDPFPEIRVPEGFRLQSLADSFDLEKVHRVMHRGFDHPGEPPADELDGRRRKLSAPNLRKDLTVVAVAPSGDYVAFCGMWLVPEAPESYVEPVATDPDYRRLGLGSAVVLEGVRRCAAEGAAAAWVGSDQPFYRSMGFEVVHTQVPWWKAADP